MNTSDEFTRPELCSQYSLDQSRSLFRQHGLMVTSDGMVCRVNTIDLIYPLHNSNTGCFGVADLFYVLS